MPNSIKTLFLSGPLIHNQKEIDRLKRDFGVNVETNLDNVLRNNTLRDSSVIIRTHGIQKSDLKRLKNFRAHIIDATCPFVKKPQQICEEMSSQGYAIVIFGDENHPEVRGVASYCKEPFQIVLNKEQLKKVGAKVALISRTTRKISAFLEIANHLITICPEVRMCRCRLSNATFDNQEAVKLAAQEVDILDRLWGAKKVATQSSF